ncbi:MAG TPA: CinA family nicotinamide mononucleotide deamidase-related protein [Thermotogota bacterium]|nr:CinA family nicotinamide mononucleotide deamidase-related protein [Thermotogota bacterium]HNR63166.1 CinA family nicotinamide mononucleotide deamidase-related protein [Thermotogota bacterium]HNT95413.1 CinA family nicotinamide mononucleotide deamidase-related protein [Thermotogota bacterium]HOZ12004.1 CinA family nicotinamide mononucleotide deamidase-related protein [Thermotogota bacterium]HPB86399.1 CinA family nicotinamide mononucleotide deamidase-related protein [Thermotogota bacterium]
MVVEIITVGTEILLGDIVNTNARYLARRIADYGFSCYRQTVVGDNPVRLKQAIGYAFESADLVIATGGLGPTDDDLTKEVAAAYFGIPLCFHPPSWERIQERFADRMMPIPESNRKQAFFPIGAQILENPNGTAPGALFGNGEKTIVVLPGPPSEMIPMFENTVAPFLDAKNSGVIVSRVLKTVGIGESALAELLKPIIDSQSNPTVATYASEGEITVRVTARAPDKQNAIQLIEETQQSIIWLLGDLYYGYDNQSLEERVVERFAARGWDLAVFESITGGALFAALSGVSGATRVLSRGWCFNAEERSRHWLSETKTVTGDGAQAFARAAKARAGTKIGIAVHMENPQQATIAVCFPDKEVIKIVRCLEPLVKARQRIVKQALNTLRLEG